MPHMMPMMWLIMFLMMMMILFLIMSLTYFFYFPKLMMTYHPLKKLMINWNWKW